VVRIVFLIVVGMVFLIVVRMVFLIVVRTIFLISMLTFHDDSSLLSSGCAFSLLFSECGLNY